MILDELKEEYVKDLLQKNKRADGRELMQYRNITIEKGIIPNAEGSALAAIGDSKVIAGIKFDVVEPYKDKPNEGVFSVTSELSPIAHPEFEAGPPREDAIELARVVDRGIRSAECVDLKKFILPDGKALGLFIDLAVIDHSGNLIDTASLAASAALMSTRIPKYENERLVRTEFQGNLKLERTALTCSFEKIDGKLLLDATDEEEVASDGRLTLATTSDGFIAAAQKSKPAGFTKEEILQLAEVALQKGKELEKFI